METIKENSYSISSAFLKWNQFLWRNSFFQNIRILFYAIDGMMLVFCPQEKKKQSDDSRKKVLIVYNLALGDGIMFYGVSQCIREIWPKEKFEISIACQTAFAPLYESSGVFDRVLPFDFLGAVLNLGNRMKLFRQLRAVQYDFVVDPVGCEDCTTNIFVTRAALGKQKIGVLDTALRKHQMPGWMRRKIYDKVVEINQKQIHLIQYYGMFFKLLGAKECRVRPAQLPDIELPFETPERFFVVFPVASMAVKKWPIERYAYITKKIYEKTHMPLVVCGTNHDRAGIEELLSKLSGVEVINYIGKTNIMQFTELIRRASLVISNDTSAYHIAVARQVPVAMICGGYTYHRYAKYKYADEGCKDPVLIHKKMKCFDCNNHCVHSGFACFPCIEQISQEDAWREIERMIEREALL